MFFIDINGKWLGNNIFFTFCLLASQTQDDTEVSFYCSASDSTVRGKVMRNVSYTAERPILRLSQNRCGQIVFHSNHCKRLYLVEYGSVLGHPSTSTCVRGKVRRAHLPAFAWPFMGSWKHLAAKRTEQASLTKHDIDEVRFSMKRRCWGEGGLWSGLQRKQDA